MKLKPRFSLKERDDNAPTSIRLTAYFNKQRFVYGCGVTIHPELWDEDTQRPTKERRLLKKHEKRDPHIYAHTEQVDKRLDDIENALVRHFTYVVSGNHIPTAQELKAYLDSEFKPDSVQQQTYFLEEFTDQYIKELEAGKRTTAKGKRYAKGTITAYKGFLAALQRFQEAEHMRVTFQMVTLPFYDRFTAHMVGEGKKPNTIGKFIKTLKTLMRAALELALHDNREFERKQFKTIRVEVDNIYLTEAELQAMYDLDLSNDPKHELARDIFLIGCETAQRHSDYSRIDRHHITKTAKGTEVIILNQVKGGRRVIIPMTSRLKVLLKKYDNQVPWLWQQKLNDRIKEVGRLAEIKTPIPIKDVDTMAVLRHTPKYEQITSHTARRSGCTLMYLAGVKPVDICKVSGHKDVAALMRYLKVSAEETADSLASHKYFRQPQMKKVK